MPDIISKESRGLWLSKLQDLMDFRADGDPTQTTWKCGGPENTDEDAFDPLFLAKQAASELNLNFSEIFRLEQVRGGHRCCDCEIVFNA